MEHHNSHEIMSESVEMYLLRIALLQDEDRPVPISTLAEELAVSPVSANQMCRKLEERGMVHYEPYKGVTLTLHGEAVAMRVLRRRRLWEVFLAEKLGLEPGQAEEIACRFEHVTPDGLAERLASFLGNPTLSPQQEPIPPSIGAAVRRPRLALSALAIGQQAQVCQVTAGEPVRDFLRTHGLAPGTAIKVLATAGDGGLLLETGSGPLTLAVDIVRLVEVTTVRPSTPAGSPTAQSLDDQPTKTSGDQPVL
jgi:DtxR family transcriptional regulator, Mn-dependent transcriptional regulator